MKVLQCIAVPAIMLVIGLVVAMVFSSLESMQSQPETYGSKAEAVAANFK